MKRKINCETARNFSIVKALEKLGHFPTRTTEKEAWFLSPLRSETQASFKVSMTYNKWFDHGMGMGGNVIDLVGQILNCSVSDTLEFLNEHGSRFAFQQQQPNTTLQQRIGVLNEMPIKHPALVQYLHARGISKGSADAYCKEVWFTLKGKRFFAIGLQNNLGGWELRSKLFKGSSSPKSYSHFKHGFKQLLILEGMFDLLSLMELDPDAIQTSDIIVLNSIGFIKYIEKEISCYDTVLLYLDNDAPGVQAENKLTEAYGHVLNRSTMYKNHKDLNTFLCDGRRSIK